MGIDAGHDAIRPDTSGQLARYAIAKHAGRMARCSSVDRSITRAGMLEPCAPACVVALRSAICCSAARSMGVM